MFLSISSLNKGTQLNANSEISIRIFLLTPGISADLMCWKQRHMLQKCEGPASASAGPWGEQGTKPPTNQSNIEETEGTQGFSFSCNNSCTVWKQWID